MKSLYTEIQIEASKRKVWYALYQKQYWFNWNTFLWDRDPNQPFILNQEVTLAVRRSPQEEETVFQPLVQVLQPEICLGWRSEIPGFRNQSRFELQEIGIGRTKYIHHQEFSGWLTRVFLPFIQGDEKRGMERMAHELKEYVERRGSGSR
ncbi:conserved hypothetical protein [Planktothrix serta PCC 8927]|uniref:SRPBCC domain-containing protein n=1 Tax=Planktothrix serta PCC 8927 TaxID=671068 RepID=A0A7Z9BV46_9CYAN|nr:SRPBCC domain-containing protein [Planktothrix serta]VXD22835.1 conserved hypothetical protein [Planktothrix serta PCC 8927]